MTAVELYAGSALAELEDLADQARIFIGQTKAPSTIRAYRSDWRHFEAWCIVRDLEALPAAPETVALYLTDLASSFKASTLQRRISSISQAHQAANLDSPTGERVVRMTHAGIRRAIGTAQMGKSPVLTVELRAMAATLGGDLLGIRDRALLLLGFAGAFRRSELVSLNVDDVVETSDGLVVTLRRSKTDQEGAGREVGIPYGSTLATCPVRALQAWREAAGITEGALFRAVGRGAVAGERRLSDKSVALTVKRTARAAGLDPANYAGHSLRSGLATSAAAAGASERAIMAQTGHKSLPMVRRYIRNGSLFRENAAAAVGL
jgi:site-specific recombinase XerD